MKAIAISSLFVLAAVTAGMASPAAFADHPEVTIEAAMGSLLPGCEETAEGCYLPKTATVDVGGTVVMSNADTSFHTFTSGTGLRMEDGVFDSSILNAGESYKWTPDTPGTYPYFCTLHAWMTGTIIVAEGGGHDDDKKDSMDGEGMMKSEDDGEGMMKSEDDGEGMMKSEDDGEGMMKSEDDRHGHGDDDGKMTMPKGEKSGEGMLSDGTMVSVWSGQPTAGEAMEITVAFADSEHVNYDLMVMQGSEDIYPDGMGAHDHTGMGTHTTAPLSSDEPLDITIVFKGFGLPDADKTGPVDEQVAFTNVVPEFGTIAMMVLAVAIVSIVAVTSRSRMVPRF